ncbi:MAG: hypothetical protein KAQ88_00700, partial [Hyphomicrobiaceae bacterium]|nr:hypothetical protein [Hyphomicrobiaceae bacterium]
MQTFDQSLFDHYSAGTISYDDALRYATNPDDFKLKVKGIGSTADMTNPSDDDGMSEIKIDRF